jgi:hypothetical protein
MKRSGRAKRCCVAETLRSRRQGPSVGSIKSTRILSWSFLFMPQLVVGALNRILDCLLFNGYGALNRMARIILFTDCFQQGSVLFTGHRFFCS